MGERLDINARIVEDLYCEANVLADEVRSVFALSITEALPLQSPLRRALECEGLKSTTRIMHVLAWLLNQRAYLSGEMKAHQWSRHASLPPDRMPNRDLMDQLDLGTQQLIAQTQLLHARVARLDREYRERWRSMETDIASMQAYLGRAYAS